MRSPAPQPPPPPFNTPNQPAQNPRHLLRERTCRIAFGVCCRPAHDHNVDCGHGLVSVRGVEASVGFGESDRLRLTMDPLSVVRELIEYNYWARDRQLQACATLSWRAAAL
jgi:hypothetical protein